MPEPQEQTDLTTHPANEPMKVAAWILQESFTNGSQTQLVYFRGSFWEYFGGRWCRRSNDWLESRVWQETEDLMVWTETAKGPKLKKFSQNSFSIRDVARALRALPAVRVAFTNVPAWLGGFVSVETAVSGTIYTKENLPPPELCVGTETSVYCLPTLNKIPRTEAWFDLAVVPVTPDDRKPERWLHCLGQWGCGSEVWATLLQRWMGYCLMNHRRYAKWLLMYGKARAGKGTIVALIQKLVGNECFKSLGIEQLATSQFDLQGLENTKVLSITEANYNKVYNTDRAAAIIKRFVGADPQRIDLKYQEPLMNCVIPAAPMIQANDIPRLPDKAGSISSKMLVLPFNWSALDAGNKPDPQLLDKLMEELPGIAGWALEGARDLVASGGVFPVVEEATEVREAFGHENAPFDQFLEDCFTQNSEGWVASELIWERWVGWASQHNVKNSINRNHIRYQVKEGSTWPLTLGRKSSGKRGLKGMSLKTEAIYNDYEEDYIEEDLDAPTNG